MTAVTGDPGRRPVADPGGPHPGPPPPPPPPPPPGAGAGAIPPPLRPVQPLATFTSAADGGTGAADAEVAGNLTDVSLADLLRTLARTESTGVLQVGGSSSAQVCLAGGDLYLATSSTGPSLRQEVVGAGLVTATAWDAAEQVVSVDGSALADALVKVGGVDAASLRHLVYEHTVTAIFELMVPSTDPFRFLAEQRHPFGSPFRFKVEQVLRDAGRRVDAWRAIAEAIPSTSVVMRIAPSLPIEADGVTVSGTEWQVLAALDGRRTVAEIIRSSGMSAFTVCSALHRLLTAGAIEVDERP